ncbi:hypothetical protein RUND412_006557 [Rhizina undulata]
MSLWRYYTTLSPRTRLLVGGSVIAYALAGLYVSDAAEEKFDLLPTEADKKRLEELVPRIRVVDSNTAVEGRDGRK